MSSRLRDIAEQTKYSGGRRVNRRVDTRLFRGIVRQVDSHNKVVEEREAWEEHERRKRLEEDRLKAKIKRRQAERDRPRKSTDSELSRTNPAKRSKRDASPPRSSLAGPWTKKLLAMEASDPDRWGHEGFRQLHPEVFKDNKPSALGHIAATEQRFAMRDDLVLSGDGSSSDSSDDRERRKRRERKKKSKKEKKEKRSKKKKKKKSRRRSD